jgi:hypothetical protein
MSQRLQVKPKIKGYDVSPIQVLLFCRLASQGATFCQFQPAKIQINSTAMMRRQGRTFLSKQKFQISRTSSHLG